jgi:hypothetical protein
MPILHRGGYPRLLSDGGRSYYDAGNKIKAKNENIMLYTIAVVMLVLWALGLVTSASMGGFIHILLVIAVVLILANFISGRRRLN